jgi:hypothetical protein
MPYIKQEDRDYFLKDTIRIGNDIETVGELNFVITSIVHSYLKKIGVNYTNINNVIGTLECAKIELYRSLAQNYEDSKIAENGLVGILPEEFKKY